jgi:hypothetical protein
MYTPLYTPGCRLTVKLGHCPVRSSRAPLPTQPWAVRHADADAVQEHCATSAVTRLAISKANATRIMTFFFGNSFAKHNDPH